MKKNRTLCWHFPAVFESAFYISRKILSGRTVFWKQLELPDKNRISSRKKSRPVETAFFVCNRIFGGSLCFPKLFFTKNFGPIAELFHHGCQNCLQYLAKNFELDNISEKFLIVFECSVLSEKWKSFSKRKFCGVDETAFYLFHGPIWKVSQKNRCFWKEFRKSSAKKNGEVLQKYFSHLLKMHLSCLEEIWEGNFIFWNIRCF